jgi:hypothetical protein
MKENRVIKDMKDRTIDRIAPDHLSTKVISGALYIHNGKDTDEKMKRTEQVLNKLGSKLASYAMALLVLPQLIEKTQQSEEYKEFADQKHSSTVH